MPLRRALQQNAEGLPLAKHLHEKSRDREPLKKRTLQKASGREKKKRGSKSNVP